MGVSIVAFTVQGAEKLVELDFVIIISSTFQSCLTLYLFV